MQSAWKDYLSLQYSKWVMSTQEHLEGVLGTQDWLPSLKHIETGPNEVSKLNSDMGEPNLSLRLPVLERPHKNLFCTCFGC